VNCLHLQSDLVRLEKKYGKALVVIGVHTPKFDSERNSDSIRKAMRRYEIHHPVINDGDRKIGKGGYNIPGWPTVAVIDPVGFVVGGAVLNEHPYAKLDRLVGALVRKYRRLKQLDTRPLPFLQDVAAKRGNSPLFFPGKVLADARGNRLFIADSTNHRIVVTTLEGKCVAVAGTGAPGRLEGSFDKATFSDPQGLALRGETLYVADRGNHLIRALDLKAGRVRTVAGTGRQDPTSYRRSGPARGVGLNSPWDLWVHDRYLFIAMAGHHQVWVLDLKTNFLRPFAGDGKEELKDGPRSRAHFAQPSGLGANDTTLFVADSESSSIRAVPLDGAGPVRTVVGRGLFEAGDTGDPAPLKHAMGVAYVRGKLYVADTYNSKIKEIDPATGACTTFTGDKPGTFDEPAGLSYAGGQLYVADTNAHRIRVVDLATRAVSTLTLRGVRAPSASARGQKK
jgi:DNA-binding beta-propeller fold protein YncE